MASVSVSHLIIFIAAMLVAASVAGLLTTTVEDIGDAIEEQGFSTSDDIRSDITIINDPGATEFDEEADGTETGEGELILYVKNTGSTELPTDNSRFDIFVNGQFTSPDNIEVELLPEGTESQIWSENDVVRVTVTTDAVDGGDNRVQVGISGAEDLFVWHQEEG